ncbi:hypothetical protein M404DRAFT_621313 [Pisolithus tinctorius Marx 270]|uniref:Uncharacterized protein n=1 Tax=Pisolithus tinctorius Marx 270 TaxID=870435 RepID=A0A0C3K1Q9_PISTI|nr:hypothetical protein M404DRAFT_621313 [Pisolithus tinctorius Marx 270]
MKPPELQFIAGMYIVPASCTNHLFISTPHNSVAHCLFQMNTYFWTHVRLFAARWIRRFSCALLARTLSVSHTSELGVSANLGWDRCSYFLSVALIVICTSGHRWLRSKCQH